MILITVTRINRTSLQKCAQRLVLAWLVTLVTSHGVHAQGLKPGVERWQVKTTSTETKARPEKLQTLLDLKNPIRKRTDAPDSSLITKSVSGFKEGDMVTLTGYLHLVALENDSKHHRDGDYHIQIRTSGTWGDTCFIVEIPLPKFVKDKDLRQKCQDARDFVKTRLLKNKEPGTGGNIMQHEVYVTITGQLFFDAVHMTGNPRGKRGGQKTPMHSYTCWELHPVVSMAFAPKPR